MRCIHPFRYSDDALQAGGVTLLPGPTPAYIYTTGNRSLESEELIAYELGYRIQPTKALSFDLAAFYNDYDKLFFTSFGAPTGGFLPIATNNTGSGTSTGFEVSSKWNVSNNWHLAGSYSYINEKFDRKSGPTVNYVGKTPRHQFNVRSNYRMTEDLEMSNALYFVDDLSGVAVKQYYRFDTVLSYDVSDNMELNVVGHNLFQSRHQEFTPFQYRTAGEIGRSVYGNVAIKF